MALYHAILATWLRRKSRPNLCLVPCTHLFVPCTQIPLIQKPQDMSTRDKTCGNEAQIPDGRAQRTNISGQQRRRYENKSSITHFNLEDGNVALLAESGIGSVGRDDAFREYGEISTRKEEEHEDQSVF